MIGVPFNPANCAFIASMALNANQFNGSVPDSKNIIPCNLLWDFVANSFIWVNTTNNIILRELAGAGAGGAITNEASAIVADAGPYDITTINQVFDDNYLLLPAGTYIFDAEYTYQPDPGGAETAVLQIRTNTNQALTGVDGTDVVIAERDTLVTYALGVSITQTAKSEPVTFGAPFIVKTALATLNNAAFAQAIILRAILIK